VVQAEMPGAETEGMDIKEIVEMGRQVPPQVVVVEAVLDGLLQPERGG